MGGALRGDWRPVQALSALFGKDNPHYGTMLDLVVWTLHRLITLAHLSLSQETVGDRNLAQLAGFKAMTHWVDAFHRIASFLSVARTSHLNRDHIIMALFFIIENPTVGDEFIYGKI